MLLYVGSGYFRSYLPFKIKIIFIVLYHLKKLKKNLKNR